MVEILVTTMVVSLSVGSAVHFLAVHAHEMQTHALRLESEQAMRSSLDAITRDLRLAGACLPNDGQFVALAGVNAPGGDSITIRTGIVRADMSCIVTTTTADVAAGAPTLPVGDGTGFSPGMLGYVRHPNGSGEIWPVASAGAGTVTFAAGMSQLYPAGSGVYAIDERTYALDKTDPAMPVLTLVVNRGPAEGFAAGVADLQARYVLNRNCTPCDQVDLPASTAEWRLVNEVNLTASVQTVGAKRAQDYATLVATAVGKPRNLLP